MTPFIIQPSQFPSKFKDRILVPSTNCFSHLVEIRAPLPRNLHCPFYDLPRQSGRLRAWNWIRLAFLHRRASHLLEDFALLAGATIWPVVQRSD